MNVSLSVVLLNVIDFGGLQRVGLCRRSSGDGRWTFDRFEWWKSIRPVGFGRGERWKCVQLEWWKSVRRRRNFGRFYDRGRFGRFYERGRFGKRRYG
jgi:hypothetical protein